MNEEPGYRIANIGVEDNFGFNPVTNRTEFFGYIIWADKGLKELIENVPGVYEVNEYGTKYFVKLDPRYLGPMVRNAIIDTIEAKRQEERRAKIGFITEEEKKIIELKLPLALCKCGHNLVTHGIYPLLRYHSACNMIDCNCESFEWAN